jgi:hypothetical protein
MNNPQIVLRLTALLAIPIAALIWYFIHRISAHAPDKNEKSLAQQIWRVEKTGLVIVGVIFGIKELSLLVGLITGDKQAETSHPTPTINDVILFIVASGLMVCVAHYLEKTFRE